MSLQGFNQGASVKELSDIHGIEDFLSGLGEVRIANSDSQATKLYQSFTKKQYERVKNSRSSLFQTPEDATEFFNGFLFRPAKYAGIFDKYRNANGGRVDVAINKIIFSAKSRNKFGDFSFGIKTVDDNTNSLVVKRSGCLVPFTSKTFGGDWRQYSNESYAQDQREAEETVYQGEDYKFINGIQIGDGTYLKASPGDVYAYGLLSVPNAGQFTASEWYAVDSAVVLSELQDAIIQCMDLSTDDANAIVCLLPATLKSVMVKVNITDSGNTYSLLSKLKEAYPDVTFDFVANGTMDDFKFVVFNNSPSHTLYPTAMDNVSIPHQLCSELNGKKTTTISVNGILFREDQDGNVAVVQGTIANPNNYDNATEYTRTAAKASAKTVKKG